MDTFSFCIDPEKFGLERAVNKVIKNIKKELADSDEWFKVAGGADLLYKKEETAIYFKNDEFAIEFSINLSRAFVPVMHQTITNFRKADNMTSGLLFSILSQNLTKAINEFRKIHLESDRERSIYAQKILKPEDYEGSEWLYSAPRQYFGYVSYFLSMEKREGRIYSDVNYDILGDMKRDKYCAERLGRRIYSADLYPNVCIYNNNNKGGYLNYYAILDAHKILSDTFTELLDSYPDIVYDAVFSYVLSEIKMNLKLRDFDYVKHCLFINSMFEKPEGIYSELDLYEMTEDMYSFPVIYLQGLSSDPNTDRYLMVDNYFSNWNVSKKEVMRYAWKNYERCISFKKVDSHRELGKKKLIATIESREKILSLSAFPIVFTKRFRRMARAAGFVNLYVSFPKDNKVYVWEKGVVGYMLSAYAKDPENTGDAIEGLNWDIQASHFEKILDKKMNRRFCIVPTDCDEEIITYQY